MPSIEYTTSGQWSYLFDPSTWYTLTKVSQEHNLFTTVSTNPGGNNPFGVIHTVVEGSRLEGKTYSQNYRDAPSAFYDRTFYLGYGTLPEPDFDALSVQMMAATNPARPAVLLPAFIFELKDIPQMVKQMGSVAIAIRDKGVKKALKDLDTKHVAEGNLAVQFGWRPFVQDLWTMVKFTKSVERRMKELDSLRRKGGLKRQVSKLQTAEAHLVVDVPDLGPVTINRSYVASGVLQWMPTYDGSAALSENQARRVLTGFDAGNIAANVWEEMPWSWFTDYFYNVSQMLQAGNRTIATPGKGWIKVVTESSASHPGSAKNPDPDYTLHLSAGEMRSHQTRRMPLSAHTHVQFPTLGTGQLSILGSLAVVKNRKVLGLSA